VLMFSLKIFMNPPPYNRCQNSMQLNNLRSRLLRKKAQKNAQSPSRPVDDLLDGVSAIK
jgi:hypothetical protein